MKKTFFTLLLLGAFSLCLFAQNNDLIQLQNKVTGLETSNAKLNAQLKANQKAIADLTLKVNAATSNIILLQESVGNNMRTLQEVSGTFDKRLSENEKSLDTEVNQLGKSIMNNTIYWVIAFLIVGFVTFYLYRKMRGRLSNEKAAIYTEIKVGNDSLKSDLAGLITKNADDMKFMFSGELKDFGEKYKQSLEDLQKDYDGKLKQLSDKMEMEFKSIKAQKPKNSKQEVN